MAGQLTPVEIDGAQASRHPHIRIDDPLARSIGSLLPPLNLTRSILDNTSAVVYVKDLQGLYVFVNKRFEEIFGVDAADILGRDDFRVHDPETAERLRMNDARILATGKADEVEEIIIHPRTSHSRRYISVKAPLLDAFGRPFALCGISTDVTEWRRTEERLLLGKQRYHTLVEATAAIVWSTPPSGRFESEQPSWSEFTGQSFEELAGWGWLDVVHPDDREETDRIWSEAVRGCGIYVIEHRIRRRDGVYRDMCGRAVPILAPDGTIQEWAGVHMDVTARKDVEAALHDSRQRLAAALDSSGTGTFRWDFDSDVMEWDDRMRSLMGVPASYVPRLDDIPMRIHPDDRPMLVLALGEAKLGKEPPPQEYRIQLPNGDVRWLRIQGRVFRDERGHPSYSMGGCVDVTDLKVAEEKLSHRVHHDMLTGMPNRTRLQSSMEACIAGPKAQPMFAFLLLDLDRFKEINDTFGHDCGDVVLQELRPRLRAAVPEPGLVCRLGGDEFGVLLPGATRAEAEATARAILACLQRPIFAGGRVLEVGASLGMALFPEHGRDVASLMRVADVAMYAAKRSRSGWMVYRAEQDQSCPRRLSMVGELRRAVEEGRLLLQYQPKVDLRTMLDSGAEALVRWQHPREGLLAPGVFIPIAEETGLIRPLSLWVLDRALRDRHVWARSGLDVDVAVNLGAESFQDPNLALVVADLLDCHRTPAHRLTIEVTETAMMKTPARAQAVLGALHELGVKISIDDFGTGYSSLAYLKELPVDQVKVDRSFVKDAVTNERDACIVRSVIDLGHNLGLKVVAEGVEDEATLDRLVAWGCDLAQGWLLGRPLGSEEFLQRAAGGPRSLMSDGLTAER